MQRPRRAQHAGADQDDGRDVNARSGRKGPPAKRAWLLLVGATFKLRQRVLGVHTVLLETSAVPQHRLATRIVAALRAPDDGVVVVGTAPHDRFTGRTPDDRVLVIGSPHNRLT